jgi:hypothetical protein
VVNPKQKAQTITLALLWVVVAFFAVWRESGHFTGTCVAFLLGEMIFRRLIIPLMTLPDPKPRTPDLPKRAIRKSAQNTETLEPARFSPEAKPDSVSDEVMLSTFPRRCPLCQHPLSSHATAGQPAPCTAPVRRFDENRSATHSPCGCLAARSGALQ